MKKITVIEDDPFILDFVSALLTKDGYEVTNCSDGQEAMAHIESEKPDLVLLDLELPHISGQDLLKSIRETHSSEVLPVIIFSNNDAPNIKQEMAESGANDFYLKANTDPAQLHELLKHHL